MTRILLGLCLAASVLPAQNNLTTTMVQRYFSGVRRNLESGAEVMPARGRKPQSVSDK